MCRRRCQGLGSKPATRIPAVHLDVPGKPESLVGIGGRGSCVGAAVMGEGVSGSGPFCGKLVFSDKPQPTDRTGS